MKKSLFIKKAAAIALSAAMTVTALSGCGQKESIKDENGRIKISVGAWPSKEGKELDSINQLKERYEKANPEYVIVPDNWQFDLKTFYAKAAGNNLPTVFMANFTEVSQVIDGGYSANLTDTLKKHGLFDKFNQDIFKAVSKDGDLYGFPSSAYALGLGCNMDLMKAAGLVDADGTPKQPKDWEEVREFAVKIKEATGKPGFIIPTSNNSGGWMFMPIAWSYGVEFMKKDGDKWKATFDCPEAVAALQYIKDLKWKYDVLPQNTQADLSEVEKQFAAGNVGMVMGEASVVGRILATYEFDKDKIGMLNLPAGPKQHVTLIGGDYRVINQNASPEEITAAMDFLEYIGVTTKITDEGKASLRAQYEQDQLQNKLIGLKSLSPRLCFTMLSW